MEEDNDKAFLIFSALVIQRFSVISLRTVRRFRVG